jgi:CheY-like chemotaxis protein
MALGDDPVCRVRLGRDHALGRKPAELERAAREDTRSKVKPSMPVRILVVDDDAAIREVCAELIRSLGYEVDAVGDAAEALARLANEAFGAVVTDILMPGMDGWQRIAAAIHEQPMLRLVAMTGADVEGDRKRALALSIPMLKKPFTRMELQHALQVVLTGVGVTSAREARP